MKRLFVVFLSMLLCSSTAFSIGNVRFRQYTSQDGLSQNSVWSFKQDSYGFMWVGTADGLNRFDGYNFIVYKPVPDDSTSMCGSSIRKIFETSNGELWIATRTGLCRYNRAANNFTNFPSFGDSDKGPVSDALTDIQEDREGNLWIGTLESGISVLNLKTLKFTHIVHKDTDVEGALSGNDPRGFSLGTDGHMWINTWAHGVNEYDPATKKFRWFTHESGMIPIPNIRGGICAASNGKIYIGTWGKGVRVWDPVSKSMSDLSVGDDPLDPRGMIWNITEDQKRRLWCATAETGLVMFDLTTGEKKCFTNNINDPNSINDNNVWSVGVDRTNHIWAGTWQGGVNVLNERISAFVHYRYNPFDSTALPSKSIWSFCEDGEGGLWIGTGAGPAHYNPKKDAIDYRVGSKPNDDEPNDRSTIQALARDKEGMIWMGTVGAGLYKFNPETRKYKLYHPDYESSGLGGTIIYSLICDNAGVMWVGTSNKLQRYNKDKDTFTTFKIPGKDSTARTVFITQIREKDDHELYLTYSNGMVCTFNKPNEKMEIFWNKPGVEVACAVPDKYNGLWIGTSEGMFYVINGKETQFTEANGLPNNSANAILFDEHDVMWIATNSGLCKMDPLSKELRIYRQQDGTQGNEFNQNAFFRNSDGRMWFGGTNGITAFYPDEITVNHTPADAVLLSFTVLNDPYPLKEHISIAKEIELSWRDYFFSFEYSGMEFTNTEKNQYRYMMEGFDEEWVDAGTRRYVTYTNLDPGEYTFRVMASNNDGEWNGKTAEVKIIIHPPFWRTNWFYAVCIVVLISAVWLYIRRREKKLRVEKERLESKVEERTAELKAEKEKVSEAHKDIRDSINYAKRIQDAILPSDSELKTLLPDSFVLYIPRDIVSGDFYWLAKPDEKNPNEILVAAADCTGHGVPGGFMSMIGNTLLNEAVRQKNEKEPALILNRLHKDIRTALHQDSGSETRDGMDVAIVRLDFEHGKVHYAGANRPLVMVANGELTEIRANKMPIGGLQGEEERNFTGHTFDVKKGSMIYIFTDGFADQFGGAKGKKFMVKKFYDMLQGMAQQPCIEQHTILMHAIQEWKGAHEQVDDILVIGMRM